jgi:hypothetical protein
VPAIHEFGLQAATLTPIPPAKLRKDRSYTFRMTSDTLERLRAIAAREDRSIQWVFDRILLKALDDQE